MKESELKSIIEATTLKTIEEQAQEIIKAEADKYIKAQLKEQLQDAVQKAKAEFPVDTKEMADAKKKANEFPSLGRFLQAVHGARHGKGVDTRLTFLTSKGELRAVPGPAVEVDAQGKAVGKIEDEFSVAGKTAGRMEIGEDSQGGSMAWM